MLRNPLPTAGVLIAAVVLTACSSPNDDPAAGTSTASPTTTAAPTPTPLGEVKVGDCVLNSELAQGGMSGVSTLTVVDCGTPDSAPVVVAGPFQTSFSRGDGRTDLPIPYSDRMSMLFIAIDECSRLQGIENPEKKLNYAFPDRETWEAGDQVIVCVDPDHTTATYMW